MTLFVLNITVNVLYMTGFVLNLTGFVLNTTGFVSNITRLVLNVAGFVLNVIEFVLNVTGLVKILDGVGPVDIIPSTDKLHHFVKKQKLKHVTHDTYHVEGGGGEHSLKISAPPLTVCDL